MLAKIGSEVYRIQFLRKTPKTFAILYKSTQDGFEKTELLGVSKCNKLDKFDKYEGKRKALNNLMKKIIERLNSTKQERLAIWESYYREFGRK